MRSPTAILAGILLAACASGTRVVYVPTPVSSAPAPAPAPAPAARVIPAPMPPVGVTIVRVDDSRLQVSTNQPAYLAVFEIVPNRGVTLVYPASARQRQMPLAGSSWLNVSWRSARGIVDDDDRNARGRQRPPVHHVYVVASERPLRLTDNAFDDGKLAGMLGVRLTRAADPYETMAALSRRFVPPGADDDWGEDVYTMDVARPVVTARVARIYCPDGSVVYVRDDMADRAVCPWRAQGRPNAPAPRPDSVVASNGRRVPRSMDPGPARVFRVPAPAEAPNGRPTNGSDVADGRPTNGNDGRDANDGSANGRDKPKGNNGNHYGWENGNGNDGKDKNNGNNGNSGNSANAGNGGNNGSSANDGKDKSNNGNHYGQEKGNNGNANGQTDDNRGNGNNGRQAEPVIQQQGKPERPPQTQPAESKPEAKPAAQPTAKDEPKPEVKPDPKPAAQPEAKDEKPKQEAKGMRGVMDRIRERVQADSADAKDKKGKPDRD
jgi:hypothetical protein